MDPHAQSDCPRCNYQLLETAAGEPFCSHCGWVLPSPWVLFNLLRKARNWVHDDTLRAEITRVAPPEPRGSIPAVPQPPLGSGMTIQEHRSDMGCRVVDACDKLGWATNPTHDPVESYDRLGDLYMADRFGGTSLCAIRQAPRQHCEMEIVEDLADRVMVLEEVLDKLAKLENGDHYGNSVGNEIALRALIAQRPS